MHFQFSQFTNGIFFQKRQIRTNLKWEESVDPEKGLRSTLISIYGLKGIGSELTPGFICSLRSGGQHFSLCVCLVFVFILQLMFIHKPKTLCKYVYMDKAHCLYLLFVYLHCL